MRSLLLAGAVAAAAVAAYAQSDDRHPAVKARQAYFSLLGANVGPLAGMAKGDIDYDADVAKTHAANLSAMTGYNIAPHFPAGTAKADLPGQTRALAGIWDNLDDVMTKNGAMVEAIAALQGPAGEGRAALGPALGKVGATCKACHDDYRASDF
jgi:cytochrome c556